MSSSTKLPPFDPSTLKHWLTRHLEPICDAEPAVLADYILALLKHDVSIEELKKLCVSQLEDFLDKHTESFVDSLLSHLISPAPSSSSSSSRPAPPPNAPSGPSKRSANDAFPPSGPSGAAKTARRSSVGGETARRGEEVEMRDGAAAAGRNGPAGRELQPCRDYHFRGFCARGDSCPFAHDQIPPNHPSLTALQHASSSSNQPPPSFPLGAGMAVGPNGIPFPFFAAAAAAQAQAAAAQGLPNPFGPGGPGGGEGPFFPGGGPGPQFAGAGGGRGNFPPPGPAGPGGAFPPRYGQGGQPRGPRQPRRYSHGAHGGGGPATAPAKTSRLVLVDNVPAQHLTEQSVRHFFSAFGTILALRVLPPAGGREGGEEEGEVQMKDAAAGSGGGGRNRDGEKGKAEVFYTHPAAADRAVRSEQAVFGNRFVRVYRVVEEASPLSQEAPPLGGGPGGEGMQVEDDFVAPPPQPALLNPQAAAFSFGGAPGASPRTFPPRPPRTFKSRPAPSKNDPNSPSSLAARLSAITSKQKTLFSELETLSASSSGEVGEGEKQRKKAILGVLRTLEKEAGEVKGKLEEGAAKQKPAEEGEGTEEGEGGEAEDPREHLRRLQAEATRMGLDPSTGQPSHQPSYSYPPRKFAPRPSRGRRGFKGNPNSFRLDNRSTAVVVSGRFEGGEEDVGRVREYFEKFGPLTDVSSLSPSTAAAPSTSSGSSGGEGEKKQELTVKFSTRHDAEKALASGTLLSLSSLPYSSSSPFSLRWAGTTQPSSSSVSNSSSSFPPSGAANGEVKMEENGEGVKQEDGGYAMEEEGTREDRRERDEY